MTIVIRASTRLVTLRQESHFNGGLDGWITASSQTPACKSDVPRRSPARGFRLSLE